MREDQRERLRALEEKIVEQVITDVDPDNWPGRGETLAQMEKETRGDAMWARKTAVQTVCLLQKVQTLIADPAAAAGKSQATEDDVDKLTAKAEREAAALLDRVQKGATNARRAKH